MVAASYHGHIALLIERVNRDGQPSRKGAASYHEHVDLCIGMLLPHTSMSGRFTALFLCTAFFDDIKLQVSLRTSNVRFYYISGIIFVSDLQGHSPSRREKN